MAGEFPPKSYKNNFRCQAKEKDQNISKIANRQILILNAVDVHTVVLLGK